MGVYDRQIATAKRLITKYGQNAVTWKVETNGAPVDALKPWLPTEPATPVTHFVDICFLPVDKEMREFLRYIRGTEVSIGSSIGLMGAVSFTPTIKDTVLRSSVEYRIKWLEPFSPNGEIIFYIIEFEK